MNANFSDQIGCKRVLIMRPKGLQAVAVHSEPLQVCGVGICNVDAVFECSQMFHTAALPTPPDLLDDITVWNGTNVAAQGNAS